MKRLIKSALLFLPLVALLTFVNWYADPANILRGDYELKVAQILASGQNAANLPNMDDRGFMRAYAEMRTQPIDTLALGSSHSMQITCELTGDPNTFCGGVTGGDLRDCISVYRLFREKGFQPERVILVVDPWFFCEDAFDGRAMTDGYAAFCAEHGFTAYGVGNMGINWTLLKKKASLFSIPYFQSSLDYLKKGLHLTRETVPTLEHKAEGAMRRADGSYCYEAEYREMPLESVRQLAEDSISVTPSFALNFTGVNPVLTEQLRAFLQDVQADGVQAAIMLPPYHPVYYAHMRESEEYREFLSTEDITREVAAELGIPVFGSYDPAECGLDETDFYDAFHCREEAMFRFYPAGLFAQGAA